jgi:hypothetical protein
MSQQRVKTESADYLSVESHGFLQKGRRKAVSAAKSHLISTGCGV